MAKSNQNRPDTNDTQPENLEAESGSIKAYNSDDHLVSRTYAQKHGEILFSAFDLQIEQLRQMRDEGSRQDFENIGRMQRIFRDVNKDIQKIARRIQKQNRRDQSLTQGFRNIKEGEGLKERAQATMDLGALVLDKTPIVGSVKSYISRTIGGNLQIHNELTKQYKSAVKLKDRLKTLLYHENEGLQNLRDSVLEEIGNYGTELKRIRTESQKKTNRANELRGQRGTIVEKLEKAYQTTLDKLNPGELSEVSLREYLQVTSLDSDIMPLEQELKEEENRCKEIGSHIQGRRTTLGIYLSFFMQGDQAYRQVDCFLNQIQSSIAGSAKIAQTEETLTALIRTVGNLVQNYNGVLSAQAKHAVIFAENSQHIVPTTLHDPDTMIEAVQNIKTAIGLHLEHDPVSASRQLSEAFDGAKGYLSSADYTDPKRPSLTGLLGEDTYDSDANK